MKLRTFHAAWVIARRDFVAVIFSKTFLFFLLGPLFPGVVMALAGGIGAQVADAVDNPVIGVAMSAEDSARFERASAALSQPLPGRIPLFRRVAGDDPAAALSDPDKPLVAVLRGSLAEPELIGPPDQLERWRGPVALIAAEARGGLRAPPVPIATRAVRTSSGSQVQARVLTAQAGQFVLFLLTMLLAGMVLSNLVEEKGNKIIEVLAAAIPLDALFLGKLFAMLAVSLVGIAVWAGAVGAVVAVGAGALPSLPAPAVGWAAFLALALVYFAMAYLLLGSLFLSIGSLATTVREVQTLSMPVTMLQVLVFFFASATVAQTGRPLELAAAAFPLSSPFAMVARAAQGPELWPHLVALAWQALWVGLIIRVGAGVFRRSVMKSGPARGKKERRSLFGRFRRRTLVDTRVGLAG
ncbi:MAG: ABC transporter permease [Novosphingobium sp.]|nr:ABC transporter permease [Novosphingobium sp.]